MEIPPIFDSGHGHSNTAFWLVPTKPHAGLRSIRSYLIKLRPPELVVLVCKYRWEAATQASCCLLVTLVLTMEVEDQKVCEGWQKGCIHSTQ